MGEEISPIQRIPAGYIQTRVTKTKSFQPIFKDGAVEFDSSSRNFRYRDMDRPHLHTTIGVTIDQQADSMKAAIRAYEASSKGEYIVRWNPEETGSFNVERALQNIKESAEEYLKKGRAKEGFKNRIRGCLRKFSDHAGSLAYLLDFLPNDSYGSLVYGGVSVILKAASRIGHAREGVLEALAEIPEIIASASIFDTMYKDAPRLRNAVSTLYVAVLLALEHILLWFHQKAARKFFESRKYDENLTARIGNVKKCSDAVRREADLCQQEVNLDTHKTVGDIRREQAAAIANANENLKEHIIATFANQITALRSDIANDLYNLFNNSLVMQALVLQLQIQTKDSAPDEQQYGRRPSIIKRFTGLSRFAPTPEPPTMRRDVTRDELLNFIGTPFTETAYNDVRRCLDAEMTFREQDRVQAIVQSNQLKSFFSGRDSATLLVEGNTGAHESNSSISFFSAMLVASIHELKIPVVHFFCGLHQNSQPPAFNGPNGMMQALSRQLLSINGGDRISLKSSTIGKLPQSAKAVRKLVRELLSKQRLEDVTFCIIDGVSFFEIGKWEKRLKIALTSLMKAINNPKGNGLVKLLITTPESSRCVPSMIKPEQILSIQKDVIEGTRQGLDSDQVNASMKEAVGNKWRRSRSWR